MQFEIQRVPADIEPADFERSFYRTRTPVILEAAARDWRALETWAPDLIRAEIEKTDAIRTHAWWDVRSDFLAEDYGTPAILNHLRRTCELRFRTRPVRIWIGQAGERTGWHYDGNSLDVLNVQVRGRKRFSLVSPDTPLDCYSFRAAARRLNDGADAIDASHHHTSFELVAGDMLFLPRYWFHSADALDEVNLNLNWVWTDLDTTAGASRGAARERECVAFRLLVNRWLGRLPHRESPRELAEYGGGTDFDVARRFSRDTPPHRIALRAARELAAYPPSWIADRQRRWREARVAQGGGSHGKIFAK